jgi:hypothetical protein
MTTLQVINRTGIVKRAERCSWAGAEIGIPGGLSVRDAAARGRHQMLPEEHACQYRTQTLHIARIPSNSAPPANPRTAAQRRRAIRRSLLAAMNLLLSRGFAGYFRPARRVPGRRPGHGTGGRSAAAGEVCVTSGSPAPGLVTALIFTLIAAWGEFIAALTLTTSNSAIPLTVRLDSFIGQYAVDWQHLFGSLVATIPGAHPVRADRAARGGRADGRLDPVAAARWATR